MKKTDLLDEDLLAINSGEIIVYNFDCISREYLSSTTETIAVGVGLPANSCIDAPLDKKDGVVVFRTKNLLAWEYIFYHRGEIDYNKETGSPFTITELGEYPKSVTPQKPTSQYDKWNGDSQMEDLATKHEADIANAQKHRQSILDDIEETTSDWRIEMLLGDISDNDKSQLSAWMSYKSAVKAVDVSTAPDVSWPVPPVAPAM